MDIQPRAGELPYLPPLPHAELSWSAITWLKMANLVTGPPYRTTDRRIALG